LKTFNYTSEELEIAKEEYNNSIKQEKKLTENIDQIQSSINVAFEDLPDDWTCPLCGVGKDQFEKA